MQPGDKSQQIERGRNLVDLGPLGDPERWGGVGEISAIIPNNDAIIYSPQIIRVQCSDLIARGWDLICNWDIRGLELADSIQRCELEITLGVGQASRAVNLSLTNSIATLLPVGAGLQLSPSTAWINVPGFNGFVSGTISAPHVLPASAMAVRGLLQIVNADAAHAISATFFVAVSPRAL